MSAVGRALGLVRLQLKTSLLTGMQYRFDFVLEGLAEILGSLVALVPLVIVFRGRASVAGWTADEALVVMGFFFLLQGVIQGAINPSLGTVVEHVRKGTLDFLLLKPADAQLLVSTARLQPWRASNVLTAAAVFVVAFVRMGRAPSLLGVAESVVLVGAAITLLYALWTITVSAAFYVVRVDNMTYFFGAVFDAARWPASVFRGLVRIVFTFAIPLAAMTTYPAEALLGAVPPAHLIGAVVGAVIAFGVARRVWTRSLASYTSASS